MLMAPNHEVEKLGEKMFGKIAGFRIGVTAAIRVAFLSSSHSQDVLILMDTHQIKPILLLSSRLEKLDLPIPEGPKESLISHIAHTIEGKLSLPLLKKHRFN